MITRAKSKIRNPKSEMEDYDFIIRIIQYLDYEFGIRFFITSRDFDVLYKWWERRIPFSVIMESMSTVVEDWARKEKKIYGFSNFSYRVKKNYQGFLQLNVGDENRDESDEYFEIEQFFHQYPMELIDLKEDFKKIFHRLKNGEIIDMDRVYQKLVTIFKTDKDLNLRTQFFMKSIAEKLQKPEIEQKYRLNYLIHKYNIPDFELFKP